MNMLNSWIGYSVLILFVIAYTLIVFEEKIHLKKSKPVILIGCIMWMLIGIYEIKHEGGAHDFIEHLISEIGGSSFSCWLP